MLLERANLIFVGYGGGGPFSFEAQDLVLEDLQLVQNLLERGGGAAILHVTFHGDGFSIRSDEAVSFINMYVVDLPRL